MSANEDQKDEQLTLTRVGDVSYSRPLPRALLRDGRLSFAARGFFAFLWDLPRNWKPRVSHLAQMSPLGKDGLASLRKELEGVQALRVEVIRLTPAEAQKLNAACPGRARPYRAGQVRGSRWVLFAPERWALERPLGNDPTGNRESRNPVGTDSGEDASKGSTSHGSPTTEPTTTQGNSMGGGGLTTVEVDEIIAATRADDERRRIDRTPGFWLHLENRLKSSGANRADLDVLAGYRRRQEEAKLIAARAAERQAVESVPIDLNAAREKLSRAKAAIGAGKGPRSPARSATEADDV